ncbi:peptide transporter family 1 isoform X2 [Folsomia candida]|uniref:peptide transporter family 1 isoform X2 n=1 Tax=Folsomia candida TaxID=158441 RepID=UPI00160532E5|nr:peptide transporter family 1 isoform X2 [Folsomia candida]
MSQLDISNLSGLRISPSNEDDLEKDPNEKKIKYPKSVFFIIATELSERFSYYGMRAVLTIYMRNMLNFNEDKATTFYHTFLLMCYGLPIVWGIIADSFWGKYTTIWIVSLIFALGNVILTLSSIPPLNLPAIPLTMIGLFLMALGTSGMKPCVAPFGGEQFKLPAQAKYLQQFFSVFFFAVTVGNMISTIITPVFRRDIQCFGIGCYPLAFGVPSVTMLFAVGVFVSGKSLYKINPPAGNMLVKVVRCITHALVNKKYSDQEKSNWLDYADDKFDAGLINDIKMLLRVLVYYIPIPMFFALYEQLGSRWTLMATRMDGRIGNSSFIIKPDQMQVSNAILMFIFIPIFQALVYPLFRKCRLLKRPLQRMGVGGFIAALSFFVAGIIELQIEKNHYIPPSPSETHLKFVNTLPCPVLMTNNLELDNSTLVIGPENAQIVTFVNTNRLGMTLTLNESCDSLASINNRKWVGEVPLMLGSLQAVFIFVKNNTLVASISATKEDFVKSNEGNAKVRIVINGISNNNIPPLEMITLKSLRGDAATYDMNVIKGSNDFSYTSVSELPPGDVVYAGTLLSTIFYKIFPTSEILVILHGLRLEMWTCTLEAATFTLYIRVMEICQILSSYK